MELPGIIAHCVIMSSRAHGGKQLRGVVKYTKKNTSRLQNHVLPGHAKDFNIILALLELWNTSQPDDASETSTYNGSRKRRKADEICVGKRLSYFFLPCHTYGDNNTKQREFEVNFIDLMAHESTLLSLVEDECLRKMTQDIEPQL